MFDEDMAVHVEEDGVVRNTEWFNPTDKEFVIEIHVETPKSGRKPSIEKPLLYRERTGNILFRIKPGETKQLSSDHDNAIQKVRDGVVVSGLCPPLVNKGQKE